MRAYFPLKFQEPFPELVAPVPRAQDGAELSDHLGYRGTSGPRGLRDRSRTIAAARPRRRCPQRSGMCRSTRRETGPAPSSAPDADGARRAGGQPLGTHRGRDRHGWIKHVLGIRSQANEGAKTLGRPAPILLDDGAHLGCAIIEQVIAGLRMGRSCTRSSGTLGQRRLAKSGQPCRQPCSRRRRRRLGVQTKATSGSIRAKLIDISERSPARPGD